MTTARMTTEVVGSSGSAGALAAQGRGHAKRRLPDRQVPGPLEEPGARPPRERRRRGR